jgi:hypothetical protein
VIVALAVVLAARPSAGHSSGVAGSPPDATACEIAEAVVSEAMTNQSDRRWLVVSSAEAVSSEVALQWVGTRPPEELLKRFVTTDRRSAVDACPNLRGYLTSKGVTYGDARVNELWEPALKTGRTNDFYVLSISLPVVSRDGRSALLTVGISCGLTCGAGWTQYRALQHGHWTIVGRRSNWIS